MSPSCSVAPGCCQGVTLVTALLNLEYLELESSHGPCESLQSTPALETSEYLELECSGATRTKMASLEPKRVHVTKMGSIRLMQNSNQPPQDSPDAEFEQTTLDMPCTEDFEW